MARVLVLAMLLVAAVVFVSSNSGVYESATAIPTMKQRSVFVVVRLVNKYYIILFHVFLHGK